MKRSGRRCSSDLRTKRRVGEGKEDETESVPNSNQREDPTELIEARVRRLRTSRREDAPDSTRFFSFSLIHRSNCSSPNRSFTTSPNFTPAAKDSSSSRTTSTSGSDEGGGAVEARFLTQSTDGQATDPTSPSVIARVQQLDKQLRQLECSTNVTREGWAGQKGRKRKGDASEVKKRTAARPSLDLRSTARRSMDSQNMTAPFQLQALSSLLLLQTDPTIKGRPLEPFAPHPSIPILQLPSQSP